MKKRLKKFGLRTWCNKKLSVNESYTTSHAFKVSYKLRLRVFYMNF